MKKNIDLKFLSYLCCCAFSFDATLSHAGAIARWWSSDPKYADRASSPEAVQRAARQNAELMKLSALEQRDVLWSEMLQTQYPRELPTAEPEQFNSLHMLTDDKHLQQIFSSENAPYTAAGYVKHTHMYGVVAQVRFSPIENTEYTGLFRTGGVGLLRLSRIKVGGSVFDPSLALHLLADRSNVISILGMPSVDGQVQNKNFFSNPFTNAPGPANESPANLIDDEFAKLVRGFENNFLKIIQKKNFFALPVGEAASISPTGEKVDSPVSPYEISFEAPAAVIAQYETALQTSEGRDRDFRAQIASLLKKDAVIFNVYARTEADAIATWTERWGNQKNSKEYYRTGKIRPAERKEKIGEIILDSNFIASEFGDKMRARHSRR